MKNKEKSVSRRTATVASCPGRAGLLAHDAVDVALGPTNQINLACGDGAAATRQVDVALGPTNQINRPLAVPSPGGEGQDEGELLSPPQAHFYLLAHPKSNLHHEFKPNSGQFKPEKWQRCQRHLPSANSINRQPTVAPAPAGSTLN